MEGTVRDVMTANLTAVPRNISFAEAERRLIDGRLTELFVVDEDGFVVGIVPDYALIKLHLSDDSPPDSIEAIMSRRFLVIGPESSLTVAARYLREHRHARLAVVEGRRLIGLVTRTDVLNYLQRPGDCDEVAA